MTLTFVNHPVRNKVWAISNLCFDPKSGGFALADERGQVYCMSVAHNSYQSVRLASTAVSAMCFVSGRKNQLVVAYESGSMVVVDTMTKDIVGNLQSRQQQRNGAVARLIRCHPIYPKLLVAADDRSVSMWDIKYVKLRHIYSLFLFCAFIVTKLIFLSVFYFFP